MSNNPYEESKFAHFVSGRGFYVILAACIIGVSCALAVSVKEENEALKLNEANPPAVELKQNEIKKNPQEELGPKPEKRKESTEKSKETEKPKEEKPKAVSTPVANINSTYIMPCEGEVIAGFSQGELVKDETMGDWRTHNGIDIAAETKTPVKAASTGKVAKVYNDTLWGSVIIIEHPGSVVTKYCGLDPNITVKEGDTVKGGAVIGNVGTVPAESKLPSHLHFEMTKQQKYLNPQSMVK